MFPLPCKEILKLSEAKLKREVFDGPQIRTMFRDTTFVSTMNQLEKKCLSFMAVLYEMSRLQRAYCKNDKTLPNVWMSYEFKVTFSSLTP